MTCKTHGKHCRTPYTCSQEPPIVMFDDPMPTPFELVDDAVCWVINHRFSIIAVVAMVSFSAGVYVKFFI